MHSTFIGAPLSAAPDCTTASSGQLPVLLLAAGRDRVGVVAYLHVAIRHFRARGAHVRIGDARECSLTRSLPDFHADVERPPKPELDEVESWLEDRMIEQRELGHDAVLDLEDGADLFRQLEAVSSLAVGCGIRVVLAHLLGTAPGDDWILQRVLQERWFSLHQTLILLDENLVLSGSCEYALQKVLSGPAVQEAQGKGAMVCRFPRWNSMSEVIECLPSSRHAPETGSGTMGRVDFFAEERARVWWGERIPQMFDSIPALWMPSVHGLPD